MIARLKRTEGQSNGIRRMIEEDRDGDGVLQRRRAGGRSAADPGGRVGQFLTGPGAVIAALGIWSLLQAALLPRLGVGT